MIFIIYDNQFLQLTFCIEKMSLIYNVAPSK